MWTKEHRKEYNRKWRAKHPHYMRDYYRNKHIRRSFTFKVGQLNTQSEKHVQEFDVA